MQLNLWELSVIAMALDEAMKYDNYLTRAGGTAVLQVRDKVGRMAKAEEDRFNDECELTESVPTTERKLMATYTRINGRVTTAVLNWHRPTK